MKKLIVLLCILLLFSTVSCKNENSNAEFDQGEQAKTAQNNSNVNSNNEITSSNESSDDTNSAKQILVAGDVYNAGDLQYHILGIRIQEDNSGTQYYTIKLEIFNSSNDDIVFSTMERVALYDETGNEVSYAMFGPKEGDLNVNILSGTKISGEIPFEIEELSSGYTLHFGVFFDNFKPAFEIKKSDIDIVFESVFESAEVKSDFTLNTPVTSDSLTFTATKAEITRTFTKNDRVIDADEGKAFLIVNFEVLNNTAESQSFLYSFFLEGYNTDGASLEFNHSNSSLESTINGNDKIEGYVIWECGASDIDFYVSITPDIRKQNDKYTVVFSATQVDDIDLN